ncbi:hypothetical protein SZ55_4666 [Pseudomonas sp. FeS53a]|nr:hypothetical protein SZ55_4666 [Pseudomonas sp. FeS53a]
MLNGHQFLLPEAASGERIVGSDPGLALPPSDNFLQPKPAKIRGFRKCDRKRREGAV